MRNDKVLEAVRTVIRWNSALEVMDESAMTRPERDEMRAAGYTLAAAMSSAMAGLGRLGDIPSPEAQGRATLIWDWADAPAELQAFSTLGGDEDWVALCPDGNDAPTWTWDRQDAAEYRLPDGRLLLIRAHA